MPTNTSFKVQCPSCEAAVPVRDSALVGKKIDCPKCKYRFVVEDPGDEGIETVQAAAGTKAKFKKKAGGKNMLVLGSVLGGIALLILGVGGYVLFSGDAPKSTPAPAPVVNRTPAPSANPTPAPTDAPPTPPADATTQQPAGNATPAGSATPAAVTTDGALPTGAPTQVPYGDISNLLPGDAQSVLAIHMDRMRACKLGNLAFESRAGFKPDTFKDKLGIAIEEIARFVRAENIDSNWSFNVLRTSRPVTLDELKPALGLERAANSPIQGREYYKIAPNDLLDNLATILQSELEAREARGGGGGSPGGNSDLVSRRPKAGPLMLLMADPTTFIIATQEPMEEFLNAGAKWELKSRPAPGSDDPNSTASSDASAQGEAGASMINKNRGGGRGSDSSGGAQFTNRRTFLSVEPALKAMMDRLEGDGQKVIATMSQRLQSNGRIVDRIRESTGLRQLEVRGMNILGVGLYEFDPSRFRAEMVVEMFREADAKAYEEVVKAALPPAAQALGLYLGGLQIDVNSSGGGGGSSGRSGGGGAGGMESLGGPPAPGTTPTGGGGGGSPAGGGSSDGPKSSIGLARNGRLLTLTADLNMTLKAYDRIYELAESVVIRMKGMVDMASPTPHWHQLGQAAVSARGKDGIVPRGTFVREESMGGKVSRNFPPHQRVSWLASLLPFLGHEDLYNRIDRKKSWRDEENQKQGAILVPEFLNPRFSRQSWRASVPSLGFRDQGATHVVGVAGIGPDAGDYSLGDPAVAKKIGMVGYDRRANMKDVTDGASNTIYMIQVPPTLPRPWIAGGGATVTGIPEKDSVRPFVVTGANGKRGATVIMADGSVRFISEMVSDDVFKALATIRGGEEIVDLDKQAPKVDPPKRGGEMRTASAGGSTGDSARPQQPAGDLK